MERWHDFVLECPLHQVRPEEVIEITCLTGDDPWLEPMRMRYCDIAVITNVYGLVWRRIEGQS